MWNDKETTNDLLNFQLLANTAANLIDVADNDPISIGVSGTWGVGKTSLVKMIGESLKNEKRRKKYIIVDFNAWLYQGYEDARFALLQKVADELKSHDSQKLASGKIQKLIEKICTTAKTLKVPSSLLLASVDPQLAIIPLALQEPLAKLKDFLETEKFEEAKKLVETFFSSSSTSYSNELLLTKEISLIRDEFGEILNDLDSTLVILVDDLDRCLPQTAISTLEAMRLLLFIPSSVFIIAADEDMIRSAVKKHFDDEDIDSNHITSYFDKLIQIPLQVPRLGENEVKVYIMSMLADLAHRNDRISVKDKDSGDIALRDLLKKSWSKPITVKDLQASYSGKVSELENEIETADQLASIMISSEIAGNPRLIKRFLNNVIIYEAMAKAQEVPLDYLLLIKLLLFMRCAKKDAQNFLIDQIKLSTDGKIEIFQEIEELIKNGKDLDDKYRSFNDPFIQEWLKLKPSLVNCDLRPMLFLSKNKSISFTRFEEESQNVIELFELISKNSEITIQVLESQLEPFTNDEVNQLFRKVRQLGKTKKWEKDLPLILAVIANSKKELHAECISALEQVDAKERKVQHMPYLVRYKWLEVVINNWRDDENTPNTTKKAIVGITTEGE